MGPTLTTDIGASAPTYERRSVLVVEDNAPLRTLYARTLGRADFDVDTAGSAAEARSLLSSGRHYAVVLCDLWLPDQSAFDLLPPLRQEDPDTPFLVLTAEPTVDSAIGAVERGVYRYLCKPITGPRLVSEVADAARVGSEARARRALLRRALDQAPPDRATAHADLDDALPGLWLAAQPIVRASTRAVYAYELLLRTRSARLTSPVAVLTAAERTGRLAEVGRAVRAQAALRAAALAPGERLFVNLHPDDVTDAALLDDADPLLPYAGSVTLELTERARLDGVPGVPEAVARLRAAGYQIAIDDLGAGYAGLSSLAELRPDVVKLDMSLVRNVDRDPTRARLVRAVAELGLELGIEVVAEGIETPAERDTVHSLGCDLLQGYLLARPGAGFPSVDAAALAR